MNKKSKKLLLFLLQEDFEERIEIQIIPAIDVMLFLLIFFIIYTLHVLPMEAQNIKLPQSSTLTKMIHQKMLKIYISKNGNISIGDTKLSDINALKNYLSHIKDKKEYTALIVGDKSVNLQTLMNVIDVLKQENIYKIGISGVKS